MISNHPISSVAEAERKAERELLIRQLVAGSLEIVYHRVQDGKVYCTLSPPKEE